MRIETDWNAVALALANRFLLTEVAEKVGCSDTSVGLLARGITRVPQLKHREAWIRVFKETFPNRKIPKRPGKAYQQQSA